EEKDKLLKARASNFEIVEKSLRDEVNALNERNTILEKDRNALDVKVTNLEASVVSKERELTNSNAQLTSIKFQNDNLVDQVHELQASSFGLKEKLSHYENLMEHLREFQDAQVKVVNDKFDKLYNDFVEMTLHLEESTSLLLGAAIGKAIEKGMQDGLAVRITHGHEGRVLTNVAAYNPFVEVDYVSALQQLQGVNFPLLAELKSNKDASIEALMNILCLDEHLVKRLGLNESQTYVDQLMVPIHHSPNKVVVGASTLSLALGVSNARVQRIKENIANHRSVLHDVFVPLAEPLSITALTGMEGASTAVPTTTDTTTALFITFAFVSTVTPISVYDYEVTGTDDQTAANENVADGNANPFPNVDDVELNVPQ
ncbi:hypothetical protein Tco_0255824, partial [Tanacetum coccineum]